MREEFSSAHLELRPPLPEAVLPERRRALRVRTADDVQRTRKADTAPTIPWLSAAVPAVGHSQILQQMLCQPCTTQLLNSIYAINTLHMYDTRSYLTSYI